MPRNGSSQHSTKKAVSKLDPSRYTPEYCEALLRLDPGGCDRIFAQVQKDLEIIAKRRPARRRWKSKPVEIAP